MNATGWSCGLEVTGGSQPRTGRGVSRHLTDGIGRKGDQEQVGDSRGEPADQPGDVRAAEIAETADPWAGMSARHYGLAEGRDRMKHAA